MLVNPKDHCKSVRGDVLYFINIVKKFKFKSIFVLNSNNNNNNNNNINYSNNNINNKNTNSILSVAFIPGYKFSLRPR
jgi:hypothetical protein